MKKKLIIGLSILTVAVSGCGQSDNAENDNVSSSENASIEVEQLDVLSTEISGTGSVETVSFPEEDWFDELSTTPEKMTEGEVLITESGTYEFSGEYTSITVNVNKDIDEGIVYIILNNANIANDTGTPINIIEANEAVIILEGENTVIQGAVVTTDEEFPSGAIYSQADTVITGDGSLSVTTLYKDGINSRDDLVIDGGNITVNAIEHGIEGKDLLAINNAYITVSSGRDGIRTSNDEDIDRGNLIIVGGTFSINAQNDGISAEQTLQIDGGSFDIISGGGFVEVLNEITVGEGSGNTVSATDLLEESMRGIKSTNIIINQGDFMINSYEDAVHANGVLTINGGGFDILSGDDALHADTDLVINDAVILVENGYEGIEGATITINGGDIDVTVLDDAMNASSETGFIKITDGVIYLKCQGDGIDSNGDLIIEGGDIVIDVDAIYSGGDSELDVSGTYSISGGSVTDENGNDVSANTASSGGMDRPNNQVRPR